MVHDFAGGSDEGGMFAKPDTALGRYLLDKHNARHEKVPFSLDS